MPQYAFLDELANTESKVAQSADGHRAIAAFLAPAQRCVFGVVVIVLPS